MLEASLLEVRRGKLDIDEVPLPRLLPWPLILESRNLSAQVAALAMSCAVREPIKLHSSRAGLT